MSFRGPRLKVDWSNNNGFCKEFSSKASESERFTVVGARCLENLNFGNFESLFCSQRHGNALNCVLHLLQDYFCSFNQSCHCLLSVDMAVATVVAEAFQVVPSPVSDVRLILETMSLRWLMLLRETMPLNGKLSIVFHISPLEGRRHQQMARYSEITPWCLFEGRRSLEDTTFIS